MIKPLIPLLVFCFACVAHAQKEKGPTLEIGSKAPGFKLKNVDGKMVALADFADKQAVVVIFTCNHCPDARAARGRIKQLHSDFKDKGVAVITISGNAAEAVRFDELGWSVYGDSFEEGVIVAKEEKYEFPYLFDGYTQEVTAAYGARATPHAFVLDKERLVRYTGRLDDMKRKPGKPEKSYIHDAVSAVLAGKAPEPAVTRAIGCSIKWKSKGDNVAKVNAAWKALPERLEKMDVAEAKKLRQNKSGNLRLINFWSASCAPCVAEFPMLVETYRRYQTRPFDLITISLDPAEKSADVEKFLGKMQASLSRHTAESLKAEGRQANNYIFAGRNPDPLAEAIDPEWSGALPYTVLITGEGEIAWRHEGELDAVTLRKAII